MRRIALQRSCEPSREWPRPTRPEWGALQEVLIIAAALTIQDPRERPQDRQQAADQKHQFGDHWDGPSNKWQFLCSLSNNKQGICSDLHFKTSKQSRPFLTINRKHGDIILLSPQFRGSEPIGGVRLLHGTDPSPQTHSHCTVVGNIRVTDPPVNNM